MDQANQMASPKHAHSSLPEDSIQSVYEQVVSATQSGVDVRENETDILNPQFKFSKSDSEDTSPVVLAADGTVHRVDPGHEKVAASHLPDQLEQFIELSQTFANSEKEDRPQSSHATEVASSPVSIPEDSSHSTVESKYKRVAHTRQTFTATTSWAALSRQKLVGQQLAKVRAQYANTVRPDGESTIGPHAAVTQTPRRHQSVKQKSVAKPHFPIDSDLDVPQSTETRHSSESEWRTDEAMDELHGMHAAPVAKPSSGMLHQVEQINWPRVTTELISDRSLTLNKIGNNLFRLLTGEQNQVLVTSSQRGEGVSTLSISLARWTAKMGRQVLLVDADLTRAGLTESLGLSERFNWLPAVNDHRRISQALLHGKESGVFLMPLLPMTDRSNLPSNIYQALGDLLAKISDCFELIVIDAGPSQQFLNETSRADLIADAALLVQDVSIAQPQRFSQTKSELLAAGVAKMIVAENFTQRRFSP